MKTATCDDADGRQKERGMGRYEWDIPSLYTIVYILLLY